MAGRGGGGGGVISAAAAGVLLLLSGVFHSLYGLLGSLSGTDETLSLSLSPTTQQGWLVSQIVYGMISLKAKWMAGCW